MKSWAKLIPPQKCLNLCVRADLEIYKNLNLGGKKGQHPQYSCCAETVSGQNLKVIISAATNTVKKLFLSNHYNPMQLEVRVSGL